VGHIFKDHPALLPLKHQVVVKHIFRDSKPAFQVRKEMVTLIVSFDDFKVGDQFKSGG